MHLITTDGDIVPCYSDEGRGLYIVRKTDFIDTDYEFLVEEGEQLIIEDFILFEETRRKFLFDIACEGDSDAESGDSVDGNHSTEDEHEEEESDEDDEEGSFGPSEEDSESTFLGVPSAEDGIGDGRAQFGF